MSTSLYCIDTSAIIHCWRRDYPPDVFGSVWEKLENLISEKSLVSPKEVLLELERGGDEIYEWAKEHQSMFIESDTDVQAIVENIVNDYPAFMPHESHDGIWADPYVIGLAAARNAIVVTGEKAVGANASKPKIPNICNDLDVPCTDLLGLLRTLGWKF